MGGRLRMDTSFKYADLQYFPYSLAGIINEATRLIGTAGVKTSEVETRR